MSGATREVDPHGDIGRRSGAGERADALALPPPTTGQFVLLVVLALSIIASGIQYAVFDDRVASALPCLAGAQGYAVRGLPVSAPFLTCLDQVSLARALIAVVGVAVTALGVVTAWLLHRRRIVARQGLVPLDPAIHPSSAAVIAQMLDAAGLSRRPTVLVDPHRRAPGGRSFGRWPRHTIKLTLGLLRAAERGRPEDLRAILRHELAHLQNRDVDLGVLAIVSWWAIVGVATLVVAAVVLRTGSLPFLVVPLLLLLVVLRLLRAALLRNREHYADVRAAQSASADDEPFRDDLFPGPSPAPGLRGRWRAAFLAHPTTRLRQAVVDDPARLLRLDRFFVLAVGLTVGVVSGDLFDLLGQLTGDPATGSLMVGLAVGALAAAALGTALWREVRRRLDRNEDTPLGLLPAALLAGGFLLGHHLSPFPRSTYVRLEQVPLPTALLLAAILVLGCWCYVRWVLLCARIAQLTPGAAPGDRLRATQAVAALVFAGGFVTWVGVSGGIGRGAMPTMALISATQTFWLALALGLAVLWPFALGLGHRPPARPSSSVGPPVRLRPGLVLLGAAGGTALHVVLRLVAGSWMPRGEGVAADIVVVAVPAVVAGLAVALGLGRRPAALFQGFATSMAAALAIALTAALPAVLASVTTAGCAGSTCGAAAALLTLAEWERVVVGQTATLVAPLLAVLGVVLVVLGRLRPRRGAGDLGTDPQDSRRSTTALTVTLLVLVCFTVPLGAGWFASLEDGGHGKSPAAPMEVPDERVEALPPSGMCARAVGILGAVPADVDARRVFVDIGRQAAVVDEPVLRVLGTETIAMARRGDPDLARPILAMIDYCNLAAQARLVDGA